MACETEMNLGCDGTLKVAYSQDNRLGNVNHAAVAEAVATLPPAFAEGAGGKQIWLWLAFPLMIAGFVTTGIVTGAIFVIGTATDLTAFSADNCGKMSDPGWYECRQSEQNSNVTNFKQTAMWMSIRFAISGLLMFAWFASCVLLLCLRASAANDGFEGLQRKLGELNQKMSPLNFSMRTDVHQSYHYSGIDDSPGGGTRIIYRYFLVIMNSTGGGGAWQDYPRTRGLQDEEAGEEKIDEEEEEEVEEEDDDESNSRRCIIS